MAARKMLKPGVALIDAVERKRALEAERARLITVPMTVTANDVAALQREAEADAVELRKLLTDGVTTEVQYAAADELLTGLAQRRDALERMRRSATDPLNAVIKTVNGWFKPARDALDDGIETLKEAMGKYRLAAAKAQAKADAKVERAAEKGDNGALVRALAESTKAASAGETGRATVRFRWAVKSADVDAMAKSADARRFLVADVKAIERAAADCESDETPEIAGVVFEKVAVVGARR